MLHNTHTDLLPNSIDVRRSIVDTSTLMVFLGLSFLANQPQELALSQRNQVYRFIGKPELEANIIRQRNYQNLFAGIQEIVTTSHVIGELSSQITRRFEGNEAMREDFILHTLRTLAEKRLQETLITIIDISIDKLYNDVITRIGIVDMGLLYLAQKIALPLFTEDERTLGMEALRFEGVQCFPLPWHF